MPQCMPSHECLPAALPHWAPRQQRVGSSRRPSRPAPAWRRRAVRVGAADTAFGPEPPPEWLKKLQEAAEDDEDVAELLKDTGGDPRAVEARIRARFTEQRDDIMRTPTGADEPMRVVFRQVDQWNLWIWAQVRSNLLEEERDTLAEVLKAWFILGKLGGYSSSNLQVQRHADQALSISAMPYRIEERDTQACGFHAMGDPEFKGNWMRCWFDLGTADEVALDVLINTLTTFSVEHTQITQLVIGGVNADWAEGVDEPRRQMEGDLGGPGQATAVE